MTTNIHASTGSASKKQRTYSAEFKNSIVQAYKEPNTSITSVALQYGLSANLVSKLIHLLDGRQTLHNPALSKPAFIALPCSTTFNPSTAEMLHLILAKMKTRKAAYEWLAKKMEIHVDDCHVGQFDTEQCQQVIQHCAPYINLAMSKMKKV